MMRYVVLKEFVDLVDGKYRYAVGDTYPRDGVPIDERRVAELSGSSNKMKTPLIKEVKEETTPKKTSRKSRKG